MSWWTTSWVTLSLGIRRREACEKNNSLLYSDVVHWRERQTTFCYGEVATLQLTGTLELTARHGNHGERGKTITHIDTTDRKHIETFMLTKGMRLSTTTVKELKTKYTLTYVCVVRGVSFKVYTSQMHTKPPQLHIIHAPIHCTVLLGWTPGTVAINQS